MRGFHQLTSVLGSLLRTNLRRSLFPLVSKTRIAVTPVRKPLILRGRERCEDRILAAESLFAVAVGMGLTALVGILGENCVMAATGVATGPSSGPDRGENDWRTLGQRESGWQAFEGLNLEAFSREHLLADALTMPEEVRAEFALDEELFAPANPPGNGAAQSPGEELPTHAGGGGDGSEGSTGGPRTGGSVGESGGGSSGFGGAESGGGGGGSSSSLPPLEPLPPPSGPEAGGSGTGGTTSGGSGSSGSGTPSAGTQSGSGGSGSSAIGGPDLNTSSGAFTEEGVASRHSLEGERVDFLVPVKLAGGAVPTWNASGLPFGVQMDRATGRIHGQIGYGTAQANPYVVTVSASTDAVSVSASFDWKIDRLSLADIEDRIDLDETTVSIHPWLQNPGGEPVTWSVLGLPGTLTFDTTTGEISGILPNTTGVGDTYQITVTATSTPFVVSDTFEMKVVPVLITDPGTLSFQVGEEGRVSPERSTASRWIPWGRSRTRLGILSSWR